MAKYLSAEYLDMQKELAQDFPERPGASARMQYAVSDGPDGAIKYYQVIENGRMTESTLGEDAAADFTLAMSYADAVAMAKGELDANAAFMQGKVKVTGNMGKLMALLPLTASPEYKAIAQKVNEQTEY
jgi:putative sterol carrier protein